MSTNKLVNFLNKPRPSKGPRQTHMPVVLTDSKGVWLKNRAVDPEDTNIVWWAKSSAKTKDRKDWLESNIEEQVRTSGDIWLYVWLGTCDLTSKGKKYISLTSITGDDTVDLIVQTYKEIRTIVNKYPGCKITFLEIPLYSITENNKRKQQKDPSTFADQDIELQRQIRKLNEYIRSLNTETNCHSPIFNTDLIITSLVKQGKKRTPVKHSKINFKLLADGIHPDVLLARTWLKKISEQSKRDCWPCE